MKYILEFGIRGAACVDNLVIPTRDLAERMAHNLTRMFDPKNELNHRLSDWYMCKGEVRKTWQSPTHYVAISKLDGKDRGPASNQLWRKPGQDSLLDGQVISSYN